jgi:hypothetical protein
MVRRNTELEQPADRSKVRVFYAEADGTNQSIQDLLRALTATMMRPVQAVTTPKLIQNSNSETAPKNAMAETASLADTVGVPPTEDLDGGTKDHEVAAVAARRRRGEGTKMDHNAGILPATDLNFVPNGKTSLLAFFGEKSPETDLEQAIVIGYYLQETLGLSEFGPGHLLAAFKHVSKPVPAALRQMMRNMKKKAWLNFDDLEHSRLATEGENFVKHRLPRSRGNEEH